MIFITNLVQQPQLWSNISISKGQDAYMASLKLQNFNDIHIFNVHLYLIYWEPLKTGCAVIVLFEYKPKNTEKGVYG